MKEKTRTKEKLQGIGWFLGAELLLYLVFLYLDFAREDGPFFENTSVLSGILKYLAVTLCFFWQLGKKRPELQMAQWLILGADLFLLFVPEYYGIGILYFIGVQFYYGKYLCEREIRKRFQRICLLDAALLGALLCWSIWESEKAGRFHELAGGKMVWTGILAGVYASVLLGNVIWAAKEKSGDKKLFRVGLFFLLFCDANVALYNVPVLRGSFLAEWQRTAGELIWLFYLPSQVLIELCACWNVPPCFEERK